MNDGGGLMNSFRLILALGLALTLAACDYSASGEGQRATQAADTPAHDAKHCELVMGWDPWEPYQYEIAGGHVFGLDVDLITAVTHNVGCELTFQKGSWRDLLQQLKQGDIDLLAGATPTADRETFAYFTDSYRNEEFYLYVAVSRLQSLQSSSLEQMLDAGLRISATEGYVYNDLISGYQDDPRYLDQFSYASMAEINFARLLDGEVDGILEDKFVGASIIRHKNLRKEIEPHPVRFSSNPVSIMVSRASVDPDLFGEIDQSVRDLKANGAIDKVLAQYQIP